MTPTEPLYTFKDALCEERKWCSTNVNVILITIKQRELFYMTKVIFLYINEHNL